MIQAAEKFVEAVHSREKFVQITEVVLAELAGHIPLLLEQIGNCRVFRLQPKRRARQAHC
jgi:hypothetical protein